MVGNLSYFATEAQIYDFFNCAGEVKRVVMGLDKFQKNPCGFCFVEYVPRSILSTHTFLMSLSLCGSMTSLQIVPDSRLCVV